jgi:hypothetical protein
MKLHKLAAALAGGGRRSLHPAFQSSGAQAALEDLRIATSHSWDTRNEGT